MKVVLLAGGLGTRMREETEFRPKPMVEIGGIPIIVHIMRSFALHGFTEFVICAGYKKELMENYFSSGNWNEEVERKFPLWGAESWKVEVSDTGAETPTGERLWRVRDQLDGGSFLCAYGDGLAPVHIADLIKFHTQKGACAAVTLAHPSSRFGIAELNGAGLVTGFREKPILDELVSIGFFVFSPEIFSYIERDSVLETAPLSLLAEQGQLSGFVHQGFWHPIDTYRELLIMQRHWESGSPPWHEPVGNGYNFSPED